MAAQARSFSRYFDFYAAGDRPQTHSYKAITHGEQPAANLLPSLHSEFISNAPLCWCKGYASVQIGILVHD
ncbi:uncharacterized protein LMH87_007693 [Akanthomyces muscarius]|uniref:Uncharacterized protein n=1 Tax=Akanthomyces muscarius TaxID=2231603 RepID=A0A9W8UQ21_AKAMU|nr:uncharacterized protein LMH87_007693 [Akanthomyces muscarius]KAJ4161667.1 hypothetical protein LMH87_007693 [Akanthomyces muscarius]